jgi:hypothetical protein
VCGPIRRVEFIVDVGVGIHPFSRTDGGAARFVS